MHYINPMARPRPDLHESFTPIMEYAAEDFQAGYDRTRPRSPNHRRHNNAIKQIGEPGAAQRGASGAACTVRATAAAMGLGSIRGASGGDMALEREGKCIAWDIRNKLKISVNII